MPSSSKEPEEDFISLYLQYSNKTECPTFFNRWTAVSCLGAFLGRSIFFRHGHSIIHPNLYVMLIGSPGTKKSSAIKIGAKLLKQSGYNHFAAKKTRQEKYLLDLAEKSEAASRKLEGGADYSILEQNLWGDAGDEDQIESYINRPPCESFIAADEFNNFIGLGNTDFISILGELWDYDGVYDYRLKNSKSVFIPNPTISILGGNTATGFSQAFPPESIGQGFFSRLLLVYGEPSGIKYTFPPPPDLILQQKLLSMLQVIKTTLHGELKISEEGMQLLDSIYMTWEGIKDLRFEHYANRRFTHLLKLCLVVAASRVSSSIELQDVVHANTLLTFTEHLMPKALGEFGKARNSGVSHKIMSVIDSARVPISIHNIWKLVHADLESRQQLAEILGNLQAAEKIQAVDKGFLPIKAIREEAVTGSLDWSLLTDEERNLL